MEVWTVNQASGSQSKGLCVTRQSLIRKKRHGDKQVKHVKVMERGYEPRRLRQAWQQVKQNAGAAGIDQIDIST